MSENALVLHTRFNRVTKLIALFCCFVLLFHFVSVTLFVFKSHSN